MQTCRALKSDDLEIIVIDDGSQDDTFINAEAAASQDARIRVLRLSKNVGKGAALSAGFKAAKGEYIAFLDADLEIQPEYIQKMLAEIQSGGKDVIVGRKVYLRGGVPPLRRMMSWLYRAYVSLLFKFNVHDTQTGIKVFRRHVLDTCMPMMTIHGYAFDVELLALIQTAGYQIDEYNVELGFKRTRSMERIKVIHILRMFVDTIKIYIRLHNLQV